MVSGTKTPSPQISRRTLMSAAAAPLALGIADAPRGRAGKVGEKTTPPASLETGRGSDAIAAKVDAWIAEREAIDAMMEEWAALEVALYEKVKPKGLSSSLARRCGLPQAQAMRALDRQIKPGLRRLERAAKRIVLMRPVSAQDALAKIRLGLRLQGPYDWNDDYVYALVQDGCERLATMLASLPER